MERGLTEFVTLESDEESVVTQRWISLGDGRRPELHVVFGRHESGLGLLHDAAKQEAAVARDEGFVRGLYQRSHLLIRDVPRGHWWSGLADDQDVVTAVRT